MLVRVCRRPHSAHYLSVAADLRLVCDPTRLLSQRSTGTELQQVTETKRVLLCFPFPPCDKLTSAG